MRYVNNLRCTEHKKPQRWWHLSEFRITWMHCTMWEFSESKVPNSRQPFLRYLAAISSSSTKNILLSKITRLKQFETSQRCGEQKGSPTILATIAYSFVALVAASSSYCTASAIPRMSLAIALPDSSITASFILFTIATTLHSLATLITTTVEYFVHFHTTHN